MKSQNRFYKAKPLWIYERFQGEKKTKRHQSIARGTEVQKERK